MPIQTDFNISPYHDDFNETKDYYKILFRPGVAVQVRELNQLQTNLQKQIERFGDYVLERGTIVNGCALTYQSYIPYIKLKDTTPSGAAVNVEAYEGLFIKNPTTNVIAEVIESATGYESQNPDLATLYLDYKNEGAAGDKDTFTALDQLTIYNKDLRIYSIQIDAGSEGFTNADQVVILSALELQNTTGGTTFSNTFTVGEIVTQATTGAQGIVIAANDTVNANALVLSIRPLANALAQANTLSWSFGTGSAHEITGANSGVTANVTGFVGSDASASMTTTAVGRVNTLTITDGGRYYYYVPHVTISTDSANTSQISALSLTAKNYLANVTISAQTGSVGVAYGMTVDDGVIYQKGYFSRVARQFAIIEKYSNTPHDVAVGFVTVEAIVNSSADSTLLDNATGNLNENAPGANRLKLVPVLTAKTKLEAEEDDEFFAVAEFTEGKPYKTVEDAELSALGEELARRTFDESGNYVINEFLATTRSMPDFADSATQMSIIVDPGLAYINGHRVQTEKNYFEYVNKGTETVVTNNTNIDIILGNYILVDELGGSFIFQEGDQMSLRSSAKNFLSGDALAVPAGAGSEIGKARIRSLVHDSGEPGTPNCRYRLYLFDIKMNAGKSFRNVKSVFLDNTYDGIADCVLERDASSNSTNVPIIYYPEKNSLLFGSEKVRALKTADTFTYTYRKTDTSLSANTLGYISIVAAANEEFSYAGVLTSTEEQDLIIVPRDAHIISAANLTGTVTISGTTATGTGTAFGSELVVGDWVIFDSAEIARVTYIYSDTSMKLDPPTSASLGSLANNVTFSLVFPKNVPIPIASRTGRTANVVGSNTMNINLNTPITATGNVAVTYNVKVPNVSPVTKNITRKAYVKLTANTNSGTAANSWCLGLPDVFRLRGVYVETPSLANSAYTAPVTTSSTNITGNFFIDHNQNEHYYGLSYLKLKQESNYTVNADAVMLVEFDVFTHSGGVAGGQGMKCLESYTIDDTLPLANLDLVAKMHTVEIPEVISTDGNYYDLRDCFDFRPMTTNTVAIVTTAASAPNNPAEVSEAVRFANTNLYFPVPESDLFLNYQEYKGRIDTIIINSDTDFQIISDEVRNNDKPDEMILYRAIIPPYPSLPEFLSTEMVELLDTQCGPGIYDSPRAEIYSIRTDKVSTQVRGYTMEQIGKLERRIEALEYYSLLSETENDVKNSVLPSSVDATIDRYKFGFFVDNYTTTTHSDLANPEYNCSIYEYRLAPARTDLNIDLRMTNTNSDSISGYNGHFPYEPYTLIKQPKATDGPVIIPVVNATPNTTVNATPTPANTAPAYKTVCIFKKYNNNNYKRSPSSNTDIVYEDQIIKLAANSEANGQTIKIFFNVLSGNDRIELYQSDTVDGTYTFQKSTESCRAATQAEINDIKNKNFYSKFNFGAKTFSRKNAGFAGGSNYWVVHSGVLELNYNVSKGRYLKIRDIKGSPMHYYAVCYPIDDTGTPNPVANLQPAQKSDNHGCVKINHHHKHLHKHKNGIHKTLCVSLPGTCNKSHHKGHHHKKCGVGHLGHGLDNKCKTKVKVKNGNLSIDVKIHGHIGPHCGNSNDPNSIANILKDLTKYKI